MPPRFSRSWKKRWQRLTGEQVALIGSGRTDAGVHARGQVANFRTESAIPLQAFHQGLNSLLPKDIAVLEASEAPPSFHARKSARAKTYEYRILNRPTARPSPTTTPGGSPRPWTWRPWPGPPRLYRVSMILPRSGPAAATILIPCAGCWRRPGGTEPGGWLSFTITATGFLRGMVRSLVGTMAEVGRGKAPPTILAELLTSRARHLAGPTAPPQGLYLVEVFYGE